MIRASSEPAPAHAELIRAAEAAAVHAYAPYSGLRVGCAVRSGSGRIYKGCNVENASFPVSLCAERSAAAAAVCAGEEYIIAAAVAAFESGGGVSDETVPCGMCRQFLWELGREADIVCRKRGRWIVQLLAELLPDGFRI